MADVVPGDDLLLILKQEFGNGVCKRAVRSSSLSKQAANASIYFCCWP